MLLTRWIARVGWTVCVVDQVNLRAEVRCSTWRLVKAHLKVTAVLVLTVSLVELTAHSVGKGQWNAFVFVVQGK